MEDRVGFHIPGIMQDRVVFHILELFMMRKKMKKKKLPRGTGSSRLPTWADREWSLSAKASIRLNLVSKNSRDRLNKQKEFWMKLPFGKTGTNAKITKLDPRILEEGGKRGPHRDKKFSRYRYRG